MSLSALGSNMTQSMMQLLQQKRQALGEMEAAVQSGNIAGAQSPATTMQQDSNADSTTGDASSTGSSFWTQTKVDLTSLISAVQSGNLGAAQNALQTLQADQGNADMNASPSAQGDTPQGATQFLSDLNTFLSSALSGDASGTQTAASAVEGDLTGAGVAQTSTSQSSSESNGLSSFEADLQSLSQAAQSGDTTGEQQDAQKIIGDLQSSGTGVSGHHHHHGGHGGHTGSATSATTASSSDPLVSAAQQAYESLVELADQSTVSATSST